MAHDVFISYAAEDHEVAEEACRALEEHGVKCWIAPRDVPYGTDYEDAIVDAISVSPILVLILSARSNASPHVKREIQNACAEGSTTRIIPLRIEDIPYSKGLQYYLRSTQWLDASTPPLEQHLRRLVEHVRIHLNKETGQPRASGPQLPPLPGADRPVAPPYRTAEAAELSRPSLPRDAKPEVTSDARPVRGDAQGRGQAVWIVGGVLLAAAILAVAVYLISNAGRSANAPDANVQP
nr:toll/interleukin-1 receptor domain-containing protein [Acidobacteriota bacterium]